MLIVLSTTSAKDEADRLAGQIVAAKLAACVQILPKMTSVYFWEGEVRKDDEFLLLIKTLPEKYEKLASFIGENHSYDVPEIVAIESAAVSPKYRQWLEEYVGDGVP